MKFPDLNYCDRDPTNIFLCELELVYFLRRILEMKCEKIRRMLIDKLRITAN